MNINWHHLEPLLEPRPLTQDLRTPLEDALTKINLPLEALDAALERELEDARRNTAVEHIVRIQALLGLLALSRRCTADAVTQLELALRYNFQLLRDPNWERSIRTLLLRCAMLRGDDHAAAQHRAKLPSSTLEEISEPSALTLWVRTDISEISPDGETWHSLKRRPVMRNLMAALIDAWPEPIDTWDLFERVWPHETLRDPKLLDRLYAHIHRLRHMGLSEHLEHSERGYRLTALPHRQGST